MLPRSLRQEALSRAYVRAVAARAGVICGGVANDLGFDLLPFPIEEVELFGKLLCSRLIVCQEKLDHIASTCHPAGGVNAWSDPKGHLMRRRAIPIIESCDPHQGTQTDVANLPQSG